MDKDLERLLEWYASNKYPIPQEIIDLKSKLNEKLENLQRVNDMMVELDITPPLDLWLSNSKTWKEKAEKFDKILHGEPKSLLNENIKLEQQIKQLKEENKFLRKEKNELGDELFKYQELGLSLDEIQ